MIVLWLAGCGGWFGAEAPDPDAPYWVQRTDLELQDALRTTCEASVDSGKPVLVAFSAPWCRDCKLVRAWEEQGGPLADELDRWEKVVVDVGRFDRHTALLEHFTVEGIVHWVALRPEACTAPVTRWPVLESGRFEPTSTDGLTPQHLATWLAGARG